MATPATWTLPYIDAHIRPEVMVFDLRFVRAGDAGDLLAADEPGITEESIPREIHELRRKILDGAKPHLERMALLKVIDGELIEARMAKKAAAAPPLPD